MKVVTESVFAAPWWLLAIAGAAALAFLFLALARPAAKLKRLALALALLVAAWAGLAVVIKTPTERAVHRTEAMIAAYQRADWEELGALIDNDTRFASLLRGAEIVEAARLTHEQYGQIEIRITRMESKRDDVGVLVFVRVAAPQTNDYVSRGSTAWKFDYRKRGDVWKLEHIEPMATESFEPASILRNIRIPPHLEDRRR